MSWYRSARWMPLRAARRTGVAALATLACVALAAPALAQTVIPIADIHAQLGTLTGTVVTVEGRVTVPITYRTAPQDLPFYSGYLQDESGSGINLFGGDSSIPNASLLEVVGNRVRVVGEVQVFQNTTVELTNITSVEDLSGDAPVPPILLSTAAANDARWEGALIEVEGVIDSIGPTVGGARNHFIDDGSGRTVARVYNSLGAGPFTVGQTVRARGAGTNFNGLYEFYVGQASDIQVVTPGPDTQPPVLVGSWAATANSVRVTFGEAIDPTTGGSAGNYQIFETATPGNTVVVSTATVAGPVVTLALGGSLTSGTAYTVQVAGVADTDGNTLPAAVTLGFPGPSGPSDTTPPTLSSGTALSTTSVRATFSEAIDPTTGGTVANYEVFPTANPSSLVAISSVAVSGATATLTLGSGLTGGAGYTVRAQNVTDLAGNAMTGPQTATFTAPGGGGATPIAEIQNNLQQYKGQTVTVEGQVYIPSNYRGTTTSGYIQDGSGRGINLFGNSANVAALQDIDNIVRVTGTVDTFFTTVEILNLTNVTLVSENNPPLQPTQLSTGAAASRSWEGTYISVTGPITAKATTGTPPSAFNYTVNDGSGNVVIRVVNPVGAPEFNVGQTITGRGAGSQFNADFQILVGRAADIFTGGGTDTTPPNLTGATAVSLTSVRASFSEAIGGASGGTVGNYSIFPTANPGSPVSITAASVSGTTATLTLAAALTAGTNYTLQAQNIADLAGNTMPAAQTATFTPTAGPAVTPIAEIQNNLQQYKGQTVTVEGQVYIPSNYRGTTTSGYIQDGSGRGINLFGNTANVAALQDIDNIVRVTGVVDTFFTTVEILNLTNVTLVSENNPPLQPTQLSTGAAASRSWEGTFISVTGPITNKATTGTTGINYTVNDGSGNIIVRVVNTIGAQEFNVGQTITGRGAGSQFNADFQVLVGRAADVFTGGGTDTTPPSVTSATSSSLTQVTVNFSEAVTTATGGNVANYSVFPTANPTATVPISSVALAGNRRSATLTLGASLVEGTQYSARASGLTDDANNTMTAPQTVTFTPGTGSGITPIAEIQNNLRQYKGQTVTIQGQIYIPTNYRGTTTSGYIQDGSGRGINLFGNTANNAALQNVSNIVRVTGVVDTFFTTNEILNLSNITLISSGNPPLQPTVLRTGDAASRAWEGTYILVTGTITAKTTTGNPPTAFNYTVDDGSGPIVARVVSTVPAPEFNVNDVITAQGAGSQFNADFQILVGLPNHIFLGQPVDTFPPAVVRVLSGGGTTMSVDFNEPVTQATAEVASNYEVFRTSNPGETIAVQSARLGEATRVELTLASPVDPALGYTLRVRNVADGLGNAIPAGGVTRIVEVAPAEQVSLTGPPFTFLPRRGESYPLTFTVPSDVASGGGEILLRIFDLNGQLKRTLFDSRFDQGAFTNNRATRTWDGRDDTQSIVPAGTYVVHLQVSPERSDSERKQVQIPVVVATRLER